MAVPKRRDSPEECRPISDHTRLGLNAATNLAPFKHTLTAYADVARFLKKGYAMAVADVRSAFSCLPLNPHLWPHFLFKYYESPTDEEQVVYMHLHGDFGAASMPGTWYIFFSEVVVPMARAAGVLTVPVAVYVDDVAAIAPTAAQADAAMASFMSWASTLCGINFKRSKIRHATAHGLFLGLWWNSATLVRTLEESRLVAYLTMLDEFAEASSLSLLQRQVIAGRMHRAVLTLPPGAACLLASVFALMAGLLLPWARKRTTAAERADYALLANLLRMNLGKGFYCLDAFQRAVGLSLSVMLQNQTNFAAAVT